MGKKILKIVGVLVVAGLIFSAGWILKGQYDVAQQDAVIASANDYIQNITAGRMEAAYNSSAKEIKTAKTQQQFTDSYRNLTTSNLKVVDTKVYKNGSDYEVYQQVDNLPTEENNSSVGVFSLLIVKEGGKWKVAAGTVQ